jgi:hypothetical protein
VYWRVSSVVFMARIVSQEGRLEKEGNFSCPRALQSRERTRI